MPAINALRITGPRYNKQLKFYSDSLFDFSADHTLLSMINSGGKGVLLQLLFQVVLPTVAWGKEGTSSIRHFFYDENKNFKPYPFYVAVEWVLDTNPKRYLLTGVAFFASKTMKKDETGDNIEVDYTTFVREYGEYEYFSIRDLSYYNQQTHTIMPYKEWTDHLQSGTSGFLSFTDSSKDKRKYKETLATYGIYADDWTEMVKMNRNEAGIQDYFEKIFPNSRTNMGLFKELLIPTIAERLHNEAESTTDLPKLFKDAAVIAEQLPFLRSREDALHRVIQMSDELELAVADCMDAKHDKESVEQEGRQIFKAIEELLRMTQVDAELKQNNLGALQREKENWVWQKENLGYARALREELLQESTCREAERNNNEAKQNFMLKQEAHKKVHLEKLRKIQHMCWETVKDFKSQIQAIENSAEVKDSKARINELQQQAITEWDKLNHQLQDVQEQYGAYSAHLKQTKEDHSQSLKTLNADFIKVKAYLGTLLESITQFEIKTVQMEKVYGIAIRFNPEDIHQSTQADLNARLSDEQKLSTMIELLSEEIRELFGRVQKEEEQHKQAHKEATTAFEQYQDQLQKEEAIVGNVIRELLTPPPEAIPVPDFLLAQKPNLEDKIQYWEQRKLQFRDDIVAIKQELSLDVGTESSPVWVPNATMLVAKQKLEKKGFAVMLGTEYMHQLELPKRREQLALFPLLPYALVVYKEADVQDILQANVFQDDVHFSPVPLYAAERLERKEIHLFTLSPNQANELSAVPGAWAARKQTLTDRLQELNDQMIKSQMKETTHRQLLDNVNTALLHTNSSLLYQTYDMKKGYAQKAEARLQDSRDLWQAKNELMDQAKEEKKLLESAISELRNQAQQLEIYVTDYWRNEDHLIQKDKQEKQERHLSNQLEIVSKQVKDTDESIFNWSLSYSRWKQIVEQDIMQIQKYVEYAVLPPVHNTDPSDVPPHLQVQSQDLLHMVSTLKILEQEMSMNNAELIRLQTEMKRAQDDLQKAKNHLINAAPENWDNISIPIQSVDWLERRERALEEEVQASDQLQRACENTLGIEQTSLKHLRDIRLKAERNVANPDPWETVVIEIKELEIQQGLAVVGERLQTVHSEIKALQAKESTYKSMHIKMEAYLDKDDAKVEVALNLSLLEKVKQDVNTVTAWSDSRKKKEETYKTHLKKADAISKKHLANIESSSWDEYLKDVMTGQYRLIHDAEPEDKLEILKENRSYAEFELEKQKDDIGVAEEARKNWGKHAAKFCISVIKGMREMTQRMSIRNKGNHKFDLLRLRHTERLPKLVEDIESFMNEFFDRVLRELLNSHSAIEGIDISIIKKKVNSSDLVFAALQNQFPIMEIYNLNTDNTFLTEQPLNHYFTEWETMNTGSHTETAGSGGQLVAARTLVMMMILTFKRQTTDQRYSVLISDNPFANAISPHVVDPIFVIADLLKFQWLVVTPPELVKLGISQKFPVYYSLDLQKQKSGKDVVTHHVHHGFRQLEQAPRLI